MSGAPVGADEIDAALESLAVITRLTALGGASSTPQPSADSVSPTAGSASAIR